MDIHRRTKIYHLISNAKEKIKELQKELQDLEDFIVDEMDEMQED